MGFFMDKLANTFIPTFNRKIERYREETRKLRTEEDRLAIAALKTQFDLFMANWEVEKFEHQIDLVNRQWEEGGMEQLVREEMNKGGLGGVAAGPAGGAGGSGSGNGNGGQAVVG